MKTCSGGKYSPSLDIESGYREAIKWLLLRTFISSAAEAMANLNQENEHIPLPENCDIMIDQLRAIDNKRLIKKVGDLLHDLIDKVKTNIFIILDLD